MAERTKTSHLQLVKPQYNEEADIKDINDNMDILDSYVYGLNGRVDTFETSTAPVFNQSTAYSAESYVVYNNELYYLPNGHTAGTTWANTTKTKKTIVQIIQDVASHAGAQIDDTAGAGVTNKAWSANKITNAIAAILAVVAPTFAQATGYDAGAYVMYNGEMYVLPSGHTANTTWANTTKTKKTIGEVLAYLLENAGVKIDDTAGSGNITNAWSANKIVTEIGKVLAVVAPTFAQATSNAAGSYVMYNGEMYYLPDGHVGGTSWANTNKTKKTIGDVFVYLLDNAGVKIDDTAGAGNTTNTWSVNKIITEIDKTQDIVLVQDTEPTEPDNKLWINPEDDDEVVLPTYSEFQGMSMSVNNKVNKPAMEGTSGQVLRTNGDGTTQWVSVGLPTDEQTAEAVSDWLDNHPEATTTVEDGSITNAKLATGVADDINGKAPAIFQNETTYTHILAESLTFIGNQYAWGNARYADRKNYIENIERNGTASGVTIESHGNIVIMNGTCTASNDISVLVTEDANIPAGTYKYKLEIYAGASVISGTKNFYIDFWYDGNETTTQSVRDSFGVGISDVTRTITLTSHVWKMRVWVDMKQDNVYNDFRVFYSLFPSDVTIVDTGETIGSSETLSVTPSPAIKISDTMMHKSTAYAVIDTKKYVDSHTPDMVCFRPEDYGAKGDGSTDDSVALQACIAAAQANDPYYRAHCVRGYGTYKISTGVVFNCRELDVYINKIIYTGNDAAVTISASFSNFEFNTIHAESGGNSSIGIKCYKSSDSGWGNYFYGNTIKCNFIYSKGHCIYFCLGSGLLNTLMYSRFDVPYLRSTNGNLIHTTDALGEFEFYGKICSAPNGYLFYSESKANSIVRFFNFCLESDLKNGTNTAARFYNTRSTEMEDLKTPENMNTTGSWFTWDGIVPSGSISGNSAGITLLSLDTTNALTWEDALVKVKEDYEAGKTNETPWLNWIPSCRTSFNFAEVDRVSRFTNAHFGGGMKHSPDGSAIVYYKNVAFIPKHDIYCKVSDDMTIVRNAENNYAYNTPTTFDIDASSVTITLDCSYCCIAINKFDVIQHTGKTAIVVDKLGNTIFDGTNLGEGVFHFKCAHVAYKYGDLYVIKDNGDVCRCPASILPGAYSGYNEKWTVTKETLIEPPAQS